MSRSPLIRLIALGAIVAAASLTAGTKLNPHLDETMVRRGCPACHTGHGISQSPMLSKAQKETCLACHNDSFGVDQQVAASALAADARPPLLGSTLSKISVHPLSAEANSSDQNAVVCTSCHSPHRSMPAGRGVAGAKNRSPKDPASFEYQLCEGCHGGVPGSPNRTAVARLVDSTNRSYHPLEAPATERSPSVASSLSGREINCVDCHGNDDAGGPRGPHGSNVAPLLRNNYRVTDGAAESQSAFALCYKCHDRTTLLDKSAFPEHREHIVDEKTSCATCHDAHGSVNNRSLIGFGDPSRPSPVLPSSSTGRLAFVSSGPGSGACYLNCHGVEHGPANYGAAKIQQTIRSAVPLAPADLLPPRGRPVHGPGPIDPRRPRQIDFP